MRVKFNLLNFHVIPNLALTFLHHNKISICVRINNFEALHDIILTSRSVKQAAIQRNPVNKVY